jgi:hypothetical protein
MANLVGRPPKILDAQEISYLISQGFTVAYVAEYFGVAVSTLYLNYSDALRKGYVFRNACLQAAQYKGAIEGNVTLQIWLGKQWLKQRDEKREPTDSTIPPPIPVRVRTLNDFYAEIESGSDATKADT